MRGGLATLVMAAAASLGFSAYMPDEEQAPAKPKRKSRASGHGYYVPIPYLGCSKKSAPHAVGQRLARKNKQIRARSTK